jgi:hypothetical protein
MYPLSKQNLFVLILPYEAILVQEHLRFYYSLKFELLNRVKK